MIRMKDRKRGGRESGEEWVGGERRGGHGDGHNVETRGSRGHRCRNRDGAREERGKEEIWCSAHYFVSCCMHPTADFDGRVFFDSLRSPFSVVESK